jgi:hypothetical protein
MIVRAQRQKRIRTRAEEQEEDEGEWAIGTHRLTSREHQPLPLPIRRDDGSGRFRKSRLVFGNNVPESQIARRVHGNGRVGMPGGGWGGGGGGFRCILHNRRFISNVSI